MADETGNGNISVSVPVAVGGQPVDTRTHGSTSSTTSSEIKPSAASQAALEQLDAGAADLGVAGASKNDAIQTQGNAEADAQGAEADRRQAGVADFAADQQSLQDRVDAARALYDEDLKSLKGYKFHDFFHDKDGNRNVGRTISAGLGSIFAGLSSAPGAAKAVADEQNDMIAKDFDLQRQEYSKLLQERKESGEDVDKLYAEWERKNAASAAKEALAREAYNAHALEIATRSGVPLSVAENNIAIANNKIKAAQLKAEAHGRYDKSIQATKAFENKQTDVIGKPAAGAPIEQQIIRDPKTGKAKFLALGGAKAAPKQAEDYQHLIQAAEKMQKYLDFKDKHPGRAIPGTQEAKDEAALYSDALSGNISTTTMPSNKESMEIESDQIGPSGALDLNHPLKWLMGPNPAAVRNRLSEVQGQIQMMEKGFAPLPQGYVDPTNAAQQPAAPVATSAQSGGVAEGSTSVTADNVPIIFKGGKWVAQ